MNSIRYPAFAPKDPAEIIWVAFDFAALTVSVANPVVVSTCADDPDAANLRSGLPIINGARVLQRIVGGLAALDYILRCQVDAPDGNRYVLAGVLPIRVAAG